MDIKIASEFSEFPAGRTKEDGPNSGEKFREDFLVPALKNEGSHLTVDLDDTMGYGSSFLEEAFGGLVRAHHLNLEKLKKSLSIKDSRKIYEKIIWEYIKEEDARVFPK